MQWLMLSIEHCRTSMLNNILLVKTANIDQVFSLRETMKLTRLVFNGIYRMKIFWFTFSYYFVLKRSCILLRRKFHNFFITVQKQPHGGVLKKRCSENIQQIYKRTPMPKSDLNKVSKQLYWNHTSAWVFSCKFAAYFQNTFS